MSELIPETLIDVIIIIVSSFVILGVLTTHIDFKVKVKEHTDERKLINFGEAIVGSPCFSEYVNGDMKKGVFEKDKLDAAISGTNPCELEYNEGYFIEIRDGRNEWKFGDETLKNGKHKVYPIAIKYSEKEIIPGNITVYLGE